MLFLGMPLRLRTASFCSDLKVCLLGLLVAATVLVPRAHAKTTGDVVAAVGLPLPGNLDPTFSPFEIVAGDLNRDGRMDFVSSGVTTDPVTGATTKKIVSFLNHGNGVYTEVTALADAHGQRAMAIADVNGDGINDLICAFGYEDPNQFRSFLVDVEVSFGHGDGTFAAAQKYTVNGLRYSIKTGDINGDGKMDIVLAADGFYRPLINNGNGTFKNGYTYMATTANGFTLADVNGDGRADLLIPENFHLTIAFGMTIGAWGNTSGAPVRQYPLAPAVADINGDHHADILVPTNKGVDVLLGNGDGTFKAGSPVNSGPAVSLYLTDLDHNGTQDLLVSVTSTNFYTSQDMSRVSVYPGNGNGTFGGARSYIGSGGAAFLGVFDAIGSSAPDVVMADLTVLPGDGAGSLIAAPITHAAYANGVATGDFNNDGITDVVTVSSPECSCPSTITFFAGTTHNWFGATKVTATGQTDFPYVPVIVAVGDVNNDGKLDVAIAGGDLPTVSVMLGTGDGSFQAPHLIDEGSSYSNDVALADVNNDGKLDLVIDSGVMLGNGNGTFGSLIPFPSFPLRGIQAISAADFNGDGKIDIAASVDISTGGPADTFEFVILNGNGTGNFTVSQEMAINQLPYKMVAAKMHAGSLPDLVVGANGGGGGVAILLNDGHGNFTNKSIPDLNVGINSFAVGDFNGDGINDVAAMNPDKLTILPNKGDGTFDVPASYPYPHTVQALTGQVAAGDINHDGHLDVVVAQPLGISRFLNSAIPAP